MEPEGSGVYCEDSAYWANKRLKQASRSILDTGMDLVSHRAGRSQGLFQIRKLRGSRRGQLVSRLWPELLLGSSVAPRVRNTAGNIREKRLF